MENSVLIRLLKSLSKIELKELLAFIRSPYFNNENVLIRFLEILQKYFPSYEISKENIFAELYPGKKYHDALMRNIQSDLLRMCEEFLAVKNFRSDKFQVKKNLLSQLSKRNLSSHFLKQHSAVTDQLDKLHIHDAGYFLNRFWIDKEFELFIERNVDSYMRYERKSSLLSNLSYFFAINFLYQSASEINRRKIIKDEDKEFHPESEVENMIDSRQEYFLHIPYVKVNYFIYKILNDESEEHFMKLKKFSETEIENISEADRMSVYSTLSNFAYLKVLSGNTKYSRIQFEILIASVESRSYKINKGFLPHIQYMNVVVTGLEVGEIKKVESFAQKYHEELLPEFREAAFRFCNALIAFRKKKYADAISELSKVVIEDFSFKQQIKSLFLKIYFDTNETEAFYYHIDSYRHFVRENKDIHLLVRKQLNNYINYSKKIYDLKIRNTIDRSELDEIENQISKNKNLINMKWLLDKISELKAA